MPLPSSLGLRTVTFHAEKGDGTPESGQITFTRSQVLQSDVEDIFITPFINTAILDGDGEISILLPVTNDTDWLPQGYTYQVHILLSAWEYQFQMLLPFSVDPLDLADVIPVGTIPVAPPVYVKINTVGQPGGPAGPLDDTGKIPSAQIGSGGTGIVTSVNNDTGDVQITAASLGAELSSDHATDINALATAIANRQLTSLNLTAIAALTPADNDLMQWKTGAWVNRTLSQVMTDMGIGGGTGGWQGLYNVMSYGATGDGATDDGTAFQACLDAAATYATTHGSAMVLVPARTYIISTRLRMKGNITVWQYGATLKKPSGATAGILCNFTGTDNFPGFTGNSNITILGGTFDANGQNAAADAAFDTLDFNHCERILVKDVTFLNTCSDHAIEFNSVRVGRLVNCRGFGFVDKTVAQSRGFSEFFQVDCANSGSVTCLPYDGTHSEDITMMGCFCGPNGAITGVFGKMVGSHATANGKSYARINIIANSCNGSTDNTIQAYNWTDFSIEGNTITNAGANGITVTSPDPSGSVQVVSRGGSIKGNIINGAGQSCIQIFGFTSSGGVADIDIDHNITRNANGGNCIVLTCVTNPWKVTNNLCDTSSSNAISINGCSYGKVDNNYAMSAALNYAIFVGASGSVNSTDVSITNNFAMNGKTAGIRLGAGCDKCMISGNTVRKGTANSAVAVSIGATSPAINYVLGNNLAGYGNNANTITNNGTGTVVVNWPTNSIIGSNIA